MKKFGFTILFLSIICSFAVAQEESPNVRAGNKLYKAEKFTEAEVEYRKGLLKNPHSFEATYNLGNTLFRQKKYSEALDQYQKAVSIPTTDKAKLASTLHNAGNSLLTEKKIQESVNAYKMALKLNPNDNETRYNLAYAQSLLKKQNNDKNNDKNKDKNKDQNKDQNKDDNKDQDKKDQEKQNQQQPQMNKENAQQILDALMQDEKNTMDKAKKQQVKGKKSAEKDW